MRGKRNESKAYGQITGKRSSACVCAWNAKAVYMSYFGKETHEDMSAGIP